jgi:hypothetical protein
MRSHSRYLYRKILPSLLAGAVLLLVGVTCHKRKPEFQPAGVAALSRYPAPNAGDGLPMIAGSPLFNLRVDIEDCGYIVYVNGGLVTANMEGSAHEDQPINHWLNSGTNEIELHAYLSDGPDQCEAKLSLTLKDEDNEKEPEQTALVLAYSAKLAVSGDPPRDSSPAGMFDSHAGFRHRTVGISRLAPPRWPVFRDMERKSA